MAYADLNAIRGSVEKPLAQLMGSEYPGTPTVYNNINYIPDARTLWVKSEVTFGSSEYLSLGDAVSGVDRLFGILIIDIFTPEGNGSGPAFTMGTKVRDLYNRKVIEGVYFDAANGPQVTNAPIASGSTGGFFQTQIRVTFEYIAAPSN